MLRKLLSSVITAAKSKVRMSGSCRSSHFDKKRKKKIYFYGFRLPLKLDCNDHCLVKVGVTDNPGKRLNEFRYNFNKVMEGYPCSQLRFPPFSLKEPKNVVKYAKEGKKPTQELTKSNAKTKAALTLHLDKSFPDASLESSQLTDGFDDYNCGVNVVSSTRSSCSRNQIAPDTGILFMVCSQVDENPGFQKVSNYPEVRQVEAQLVGDTLGRPIMNDFIGDIDQQLTQQVQDQKRKVAYRNALDKCGPTEWIICKNSDVQKIQEAFCSGRLDGGQYDMELEVHYWKQLQDFLDSLRRELGLPQASYMTITMLFRGQKLSIMTKSKSDMHT